MYGFWAVIRLLLCIFNILAAFIGKSETDSVRGVIYLKVYIYLCTALDTMSSYQAHRQLNLIVNR